MDGSRFDSITRSVAEGCSRRAIVKALAGWIAGGVAALVGGAEGAAPRCKRVDQSCQTSADCCPGPYANGNVYCAGSGNKKTCQNCPSGTTACDGGFVDTATDSRNCGTCGTACFGGASCSNGACQCPAGQFRCADLACHACCGDAQCGGGELCCGNACIAGDVNNCGACGNTCTTSVANATAACTAGQCGFACNDGYKACNGGCIPSDECCGFCEPFHACVAGVCCVPEGDGCSSDADCCGTDVCHSIDHVCVPCAQPGDPCAYTSCCTGTCGMDRRYTCSSV